MMCSSVTLTGNVKTGEACVLHPMVKLCAAEDGEEVVIGDRTVIEEMSCITNSVVGQDNLVEVGSELRNCNIGNCNKIGPKCCISDSSVGNGCILSPGVRLFKAAIPDNVSVFVIDGAWRSHPIDNSSVVKLGMIDELFCH